MPYLHVKIEDDSKERNVGELPKSVRKEIHFLADALRQHNMREVCFPLEFPYRKAVLLSLIHILIRMEKVHM